MPRKSYTWYRFSIHSNPVKLLRLHQNQNDKFQTPSNNPYAFAPTLTTPKSIDTPLEIMLIAQPVIRPDI